MALTLKQWLSLCSVLLASLSFVEAALPAKAKRNIISTINAILILLEKLKPKAFVSKVKSKGILSLIDAISYLLFLSSIFYFFRFLGYDLWHLRHSTTDVLSKTSLVLINYFLDFFTNPIIGFSVFSIILAILGRTMFADTVGFQEIFGDGTFKHYFKSLVDFIISLVLFFILYLLAHFFVNSSKVEDFFNWLPDFVSAIIAGILVIIGALLFGFSIPIGIIVLFSAYWTNLVLVFIVNIVEYCIILVRSLLRWIYSDPKRSWAIVTTLVALVVALGEFGVDSIEVNDDDKVK